MRAMRYVIAVGAATVGLVVGATLIGSSSGPTAGATTTASLGSVWTQTLGQQALPLAAIYEGDNPFTPVTSSPKLPAGNYTYNVVVNLGGVAPGSVVLCGTQFNKPTTDESGVYGVVDNTGGSAAESGSCVMSGAVDITQANTKMSFWAVVYNGPAGADVNGWSMTETQAGPITLTN